MWFIVCHRTQQQQHEKEKNPKHFLFAAVLCTGTKDTAVSPHIHWNITAVSQTILLQESAN